MVLTMIFHNTYVTCLMNHLCMVSLTVAIGDMIAGKGIQSEQYQAELDALNIDHLTYACSHDLKVFGGFLY